MTGRSVVMRGSAAQAFGTSREQEAPQASELSGEGRADLVFTLRENELWCHSCTQNYCKLNVKM